MQIAKFDLYGVAINKFLKTAEKSQIQAVIEIFCKYGGLVGEFGEFCEKTAQNTSLEALIKEISDVEWYLTRLESAFGFSKMEILHALRPQRSVESMQDLMKDFNVWIGKMGEKLKKIVRDKDGRFTARMDGMQEIFMNLEFILIKIEGKLSRSKDQVLESNYNKLKSRWERGHLKGDGDNR